MVFLGCICFVSCLVKLSASSFPRISQWTGIQCRATRISFATVRRGGLCLYTETHGGVQSS